MPKKLTTIILITIFLSGIFFLQTQNFPTQKTTFQQTTNNVLFVPNGKTIKNFTFGYNNLITDLIWLKTVQYIGGKARSQKYQLMGKYLESITDLDSKFYFPYYLGLILLPDISQTDKAVTLAQKGLQALPKRWEIPYYLGYIYYFYLDDYEKGAEMYELASQNPQALSSAKRMAINLRSKTGKHNLALEMWLDVYKHTKSEQIQKLILKKIQREKNYLDLEKALSQYKIEQKKEPQNLQELIEQKYIQTIPKDPIEYWKKYSLKNGKIILE